MMNCKERGKKKTLAEKNWLVRQKWWSGHIEPQQKGGILRLVDPNKTRLCTRGSPWSIPHNIYIIAEGWHAVTHLQHWPKTAKLRENTSGNTSTQIKNQVTNSVFRTMKVTLLCRGSIWLCREPCYTEGRGRGWRFFPTKAAKNQCQSQYHSSTSNSFKIVNESKM